MPRITIDLTDDEAAALLAGDHVSTLAFLAMDAVRAHSQRHAPNDEEAFLAQMRPWAARWWENTRKEQADVERLLDIIDARDDLIHVLQQDGTEAQDQARGLERARCVEWLRSLAEERRLGGEVATDAGAAGTAKLLYLEDSALRHAANVLAAESSSPDDPPSRARAASARLRARLAALEEACRPFVVYLESVEDEMPNTPDSSPVASWDHSSPRPTIGQLRRLAALLEEDH